MMKLRPIAQISVADISKVFTGHFCLKTWRTNDTNLREKINETESTQKLTLQYFEFKNLVSAKKKMFLFFISGNWTTLHQMKSRPKELFFQFIQFPTGFSSLYGNFVPRHGNSKIWKFYSKILFQNLYRSKFDLNTEWLQLAKNNSELFWRSWAYSEPYRLKRSVLLK